jgi:hypothetical protein
MTENDGMQCAFCDNEASDREGAPLCIQCWNRIHDQVRAGEVPAIVHSTGDPNIFMLNALLTGGRESEIALFNGLVSRLAGPPARLD